MRIRKNQKVTLGVSMPPFVMVVYEKSRSKRSASQMIRFHHTPDKLRVTPMFSEWRRFCENRIISRSTSMLHRGARQRGVRSFCVSS